MLNELCVEEKFFPQLESGQGIRIEEIPDFRAGIHIVAHPARQPHLPDGMTARPAMATPGNRVIPDFNAIPTADIQFAPDTGAIVHRVTFFQHRGRIEVESEPGKGTTFFILMPERPSSESRQDGGAEMNGEI